MPYLAPAKLNLFLHVTGRRTDGYHELQSVMTLIDLCDEIDIEVTDAKDVVLETPIPGVAAHSDLTVRAALRLQHATQTQQGCRIRMQKRIPMGAGLGGGSSDAATVLMALNALWGCGLSAEQLRHLGLALGADVPFFLLGGSGSAWVEGIGERLTEIALPAYHYCLIAPGVSVPTPSIFAHPGLTRDHETVKMADFGRALAQAQWPNLDWMSPTGLFVNDLEPVAVSLFPDIGIVLSALRQHAPARMTGSGSCLFAPHRSSQDALCHADQVQQYLGGMQVVHHWVTTGLSQHPHADLLVR
jgi:4-diphosphocytidyl-2-C-methyl-D-erythritol kinase